MDSLRALLYPLGFLANLLFGGRFFLQWIVSEKQKRSVVPPLFWKVSLSANALMIFHSFIQLQYPICLIQLMNAAIAWRNLNLISNKPLALHSFLKGVMSAIVGVTLLFFLQKNAVWMRAPTLPYLPFQATAAGWIWHLFGFFGMVLFASRYWVQWWCSEKLRTSYVGTSFWWLSCYGAFFSMIYAIRLMDPVTIVSFSLGLIPYIRNLMLIRKQQQKKDLDNHSLFLFAGEQSGDILGGSLAHAIKALNPEMTLYGVGGPLMEKEGVSILHPLERLQVMGFSDVIKSLPRLYRDFKKIKRAILSRSPAGVILIDYPDFNMRLAKALRKGGYQGKIIHYVCPSIWAWRKGRIRSLVKTLDHLLTILPFEEHYFSTTPLKVTYVGHPLLKTIEDYKYDPSWQLPKKLIAIFPGSRRQEITLNLPLQLEAARKLGPEYSIAVSVARPNLEDVIRSHLKPDEIAVPCEKRYELMKAAVGAFATSGTIILELGLHQIPTVATYKLTPFNYFLGRYLFRIHLPFYTLVNIICGTEVYPEFIHKKLSAEKIGASLKKLLMNHHHCHNECLRLRALLNKENPSLKAAQTINQLLNV